MKRGSNKQVVNVGRLQSALERFDRVSLLTSPTPIQRLENLEHALGAKTRGIRLFVKRDDLMDLGGGGNKLRKLEYLIADAKGQGCDTFITTGGLQSNHARLSAAAAARFGLACELVLVDVVPDQEEAYYGNGNLLLDNLFDAKIYQLPAGEDAVGFAHARADALNLEGRKAYVVGMGGSSPLGAVGYARCALEIIEQESALGFRFDRIIIPNGSAGTQAGLVAGMTLARDDPARIRAFTVLAPLDQAQTDTEKLAAATLSLLAPDSYLLDDAVRIDVTQRGHAYGIPTDAMVEALRLMARHQGLLLDPVYSGKAFAGLIAGVRDGCIPDGSNILYIMTGGTPALFAYSATLRQTGG